MNHVLVINTQATPLIRATGQGLRAMRWKKMAWPLKAVATAGELFVSPAPSAFHQRAVAM